MKKIFMMLAMCAMTLVANAQFEKGNTFVNASLSNFGISYSGGKGFCLGIDAQAGAFVKDYWLVYGQVGYDHKGNPAADEVKIGGGFRYYIKQNGLFLGANAKYAYDSAFGSDFRPAIEVGYAFFVSKEVTLEPGLYYEQSCTQHSNLSTVGLKLGISLYHGKNKLKDSMTEAFK